MMSHLSLLLVLHIYSVILMSFNFLGGMFTSIIAFLGLIFPLLIAARGQAAVSSTSVSVKRESIQPMELEWIWAICVSLLGPKPATSQDARFKPFPALPAWPFSPLVNVNPLWCSLTILKATWLLATVGYISARGVGKASAVIVGHVSRQLIKHMWCLGLNQIQTLRLDMLNRSLGARIAAHGRVSSEPFFGLRLGQIMSFDPCLSHCLRLWILALVYRLFDPDQQGSTYNDNLMRVRKGSSHSPMSCSEKNMCFEVSLGQPNGHKANLISITSILSPPLHPSIPEAPVPRLFVCITYTVRYSATKLYETCGENEQLFRDYPFDHAQRLLAAVLCQFPGLNTDDIDLRGTMKSVHLQKPNASNNSEQMMLPGITLQQIQDSFSLIPRLEYLQSPNRKLSLCTACVSAMNCLGTLMSVFFVARFALGQIIFLHSFCCYVCTR